MTEQQHSKSLFARVLDMADAKIAWVEAAILIVSIFAMAINTIANVVARFLFDHSIVFAEELNSILILMTTFAGLGYAARQGRHIRMSAIYDAMGERVRKAMMMVITAGTALILLGFAVLSAAYIIDIYPRGRIMPALGVPVFAAYLWVPVGFFVSGVQYAIAAYKNLMEEEIFISTTMRDEDLREG